MNTALLSKIRNNATPLQISANPGQNYAKLIEAVGDAEVVMIGEASHGTQDFYRERAEISKLLIEKKGFTFIAAEADWPDAYRINRFVQNGRNADNTAVESLGDFRRFPMWMWRNNVMTDFVQWLRDHNDRSIEAERKVAFYGMDLYSFFSSMDAVIEYLDQVSPEDAKIARKRYSSFDRFQGEPQSYGYATGFGLSKSYESEVIATLMDLHKKGEQYLLGGGGLIDGDELFYIKQNAEVVKNAENYYRKMYHADESTWNLRDKHMADCISNLFQFLKKKFPNRKEKAIIWAHNSHLGDARATDKGRRRHEWNVGQLMRERLGIDRTFNIGFTTYTGTVTAAKSWDKPANCYKVRNGFFGSYEYLLHTVGENWNHKDFSLIFRSNSESVPVNQELVDALTKSHYERYIGVIYRPDTEKGSHFSMSTIPKEWDAVIHIDQTKALIPIDLMHGPWESQYTELNSVYDPDMAPELEISVPIPSDMLEWRVDTAKKLNEIGLKLLGEGHLRLAKEKLDKSLQYIEYDIVHHPELQQLRIQIMLNHAAVAYELHSWATVTRDCMMVLELQPHNVEAHLLLGETCKMKGQLADAQKHFDRAAKYTAKEHMHRTPVATEERR